MKAGKYLLVPWLSLAVYTVLSLHNGTSGMAPYRELLVEREKILENLDTLEHINRKLEGSMDALLYDSETIRIRARELGYGEAGERFIRIVGLSGGKPGELRPGTIRNAVKPPVVSGAAHRLIAFCCGALLFGFFAAADVLKRRPLNETLPET